MRDPGPLAHPVEQGTFNPKVQGSRPWRPTTPAQQNPVLHEISCSTPQLAANTESGVARLNELSLPPAPIDALGG